MGRKRHSAEEVIDKLRHADVEHGKSNTVAGVCQLLGATELMYFRRRKEYDRSIIRVAFLLMLRAD
jgi:hypothetical protein